jgi:hypothetical protein
VIPGFPELVVYWLNTMPPMFRLYFFGCLVAGFVIAFIVRRLLHRSWRAAILSGIFVSMLAVAVVFAPMPTYTVTYYTYPH